MPINWSITKTTKEWRTKEGYTQEEAATILGISRVAYNRIETGRALPKIETLIMMQWIGDKTKEKEKNEEYKGYSVLRIGGIYEIDIEEE